MREIDDDEGRRLVRIVRRGTGSVVTWRRAQMVLLSARGMDAAGIARVAFTSEDRVRDVIRNVNADGFGSLYPKYRGGRAPKFTLPQRREIKKTARSKPADLGLPFSAWSLPKLAEFLVAEGVVDDISHEGLRLLLREEGVTFQRLKTWKASRDPDYAVKKARVEHLYAIADGEVSRSQAGRRGPGMRATYHRTEGVRHLLAAYDLHEDKVYGHIKTRRTRTRFLEFCRYLRTLCPPAVRIAIICDNYSPHLTTAEDGRVGARGQRQQRGNCLHADECVVVKPDRGPVHGPAVLRAGRHRPRHPPGAGQHDPPVHHLAQQPRLRRAAPPDRQAGKRSLMRH
ncbi:MAG: helix-turn-helix domain-containing protein [Streptosporangiaceae bacterium]